MMAVKTLSICIPTYNRAKALDRTLSTLSSEIAGVEDAVEICISDNGSPDETPEVLKRWENRLPLIHSRNENNIGYDRNVLAVTKLASAEYVWYMGDDDVVTEGAIKKLTGDLKLNKNADMKAIYVNGLAKNKWMAKCGFSGFRVFEKESLPIKPNTSFNGCICIRNADVSKVIEKIELRNGMLYKVEYDDFVFHDFAHSYLFMECLRASRLIGVAADYGVVVIADGNRIPYRKKLYLELIIVKYVLEMKKRYPWFREAELIVDSMTRVIGRTFINSAFALENPQLEHLFQAYLSAVMRIMELEKRTFEKAALAAFAKLRCVPGFRQLFMLIFAMLKKALNLPFDNKQDDSPILAANEAYALRTLPGLLA